MRKALVFLLIVVTLLIATAAVTAQGSTEQCTASGNNINLRAGPGTGYGVVGTLVDTLPITGQSLDGGWYQVAFEDQAAWVAAYVITTNGDCSDIPAAVSLEAFECPPGQFTSVRPVGWNAEISADVSDGCGFFSESAGAILLMSTMDASPSQVLSDPDFLGPLVYSMQSIVEPYNAEVGSLDWTIYRLQAVTDTEELYMDLGVADATGGGTHLVMMFMPYGVSDPAALYTAVFEPIIDAFEPMADGGSTEEVAAKSSSETGVSCTAYATSSDGVPVHVGPGQNRGVFTRLTPDMGRITVSGKQDDAQGNLWYQLSMDSVSANELWVAAAKVETAGGCGAISEADAPPIVPASPPVVSEPAASEGSAPQSSPGGNHSPVVTGATWQGTCQTGLMPNISWYDVDGDAVRLEVQQMDGSYFSHIGISGAGETSVLHDFSCMAGYTCAGMVIVSDAAGNQSRPYVLRVSCD